MLSRFLKSCICVLLVLLATTHASVLVTIQSQSQEEMDALTAAVDTASINPGGPMRTTLGAIEATMSRVVDVDSPYLVTVPQSMPTLTKLSDIEYDDTINSWKFKYKSMAIDPSNTVNDFKRILYLSKTGNFVSFDNGNPCLSESTTNSDCLTALQTNYVTPVQTLASDTDYLEFTGDVTSVVTQPDSTSLVQEIDITIPHTVVRDNIARREITTHPTEGQQIQYTFGIGMAFVGSGNNMIIFDTFTLIENNRDQVAITRLNTYAVAKHVSFWTQQVEADPSIRVVHIEYVLNVGQTLAAINASINAAEITDEVCAAMQAKIDAMDDATCITTQALCSPQHYETTTEYGLQTWASYTLPLPEGVTEFKINTLLTTNDGAGLQTLSSLNFITKHTPQTVCAAHTQTSFDPIDHVDVSLYRGHSLVQETLTDTFDVQNATQAVGLPDTLMTLVLSPKDAAGLNYFTSYTDEHINLDQVYMSHAKHATDLPQSISNTIQGGDNGRSLISLDATLLQQCPVEVADASFTLTNDLDCITTLDWDVTGHKERPKSSPHLHFVRRITNSPADRDWLRDNVFSGVTEAATTFLANTEALVPTNKRAYSQIYYIWPVYQWPDESPIGLRDKAIVSFTWSVTKVAPPAPQARRLLSESFSVPPRIAATLSSPSNIKRPSILLSGNQPAHPDMQAVMQRVAAKKQTSLPGRSRRSLDSDVHLQRVIYEHFKA